jgi:4'-phosphopantetheinyl transferase
MAENKPISTKRFAPWTSSPKGLRLVDDEVHVWRAYVDPEESFLRTMRKTLSEDEIARAEQFYFKKDRDRYVAARGMLRTILSRYLQMPPNQLQFIYNPHGKPALTEIIDSGGMRFNLSHSYEMVLYAITRKREVGVDLEHIKVRPLQEDIAERFFSPEETLWIRTLPQEKQAGAFFACWTAREAYLKARGDGIALHAGSPGISFIPDSKTTRASVIREAGEGGRTWSIWQLEPAPGYAGALVVEGDEMNLRCFTNHKDSPS